MSREITLSSVSIALETQCRVIKAMLLRDMQARYGMHKLGFMWALLEPALLVTMFVLVLVFIRTGEPGGMPRVPFILCGILPFLAFRNTQSAMQSALSGNRSMLGFPQVTTFDTILAAGLLDLLVMLCVFVLMLFLCHLAGFDMRMERPLICLAVFLTSGTIAIGIGFGFATLSPIMPSVKQVTSLLFGRPLLLGSGVFYTAEAIPMPFREWLLYNPILHVTELMRSAYFVQFESSYGDWNYVLTWAVGALAFGLLTHQALRRRAIVGL